MTLGFSVCEVVLWYKHILLGLSSEEVCSVFGLEVLIMGQIAK